ncbi:GTP cyclohydrolase 1 [Arachnomyces sp. PD_36]|nr:GTP cyclohydrolase 1 [Arachnomyces sp. PD_36]
MVAGSSPPLGPKPKSALPAYLLNGDSHHQPLSNRARERESLNSSIRSSFAPRLEPLDAKELDSGSEEESVPRGHSSSTATAGRNGDHSNNATSTTKYISSSGKHDDSGLAHHEPTPAKTSLSEPPRDPRDQAAAITPTLSRPASPYTLNPPVDFDGLSWPCPGTRERLESTPEETEKRIQKLAGAVRTIFECVGEDPEREGIRETPERYAKALMFFTKGYEENVRDLVNGAVFHEDHDELVIVKDIEVFSLCEHHLVPFTGKMHIGYIPDRRVLGLSKLARLAEMFARRLQVQERMTKQVALAISEVLKPRGVAVVMESSHLCMVMRGVQKTSSTTTTSCMLGCMRSSAKTREEFLSLLNRK